MRSILFFLFVMVLISKILISCNDEEQKGLDWLEY